MSYTSASLKTDEKEEIKELYESDDRAENMRIGEYLLFCVQQANSEDVTIETTPTDAKLDRIENALQKSTTLLEELETRSEPAGATNASSKANDHNELVSEIEDTISKIESLEQAIEELTTTDQDPNPDSRHPPSSEDDLAAQMNKMESSLKEITHTVQNIDQTLDRVTN